MNEMSDEELEKDSELLLSFCDFPLASCELSKELSTKEIEDSEIINF